PRQELNGETHPGIGHNKGPALTTTGSSTAAINVVIEQNEARRNVFNATAAANLKTGLYFSQLNCIFRPVEDPSVTQGAFRTLCRYMKRTDTKTGMSYPGRAWMAAEIIYYDRERQPQHYSEQTISNYTNDLRTWGYLLQDKRAADGKGRAVSHYVTTTPTSAELQAAITKWCMELRKGPDRAPADLLRKADLLASEVSQNDGLTYSPGKVNQEADLLHNSADLLSENAQAIESKGNPKHNWFKLEDNNNTAASAEAADTSKAKSKKK